MIIKKIYRPLQSPTMKAILTPELFAIFSSWGVVDGAYIAGGAIRSVFDGTPIGDIDIFFSDEAAYHNARKILLEHDAFQTNYSNFGVDDFQMPNGLKYQLVHRNYRSIRETLEDFDFHAACFAYDGTYLYYTRDAYKDAKRKVIRYNSIKMKNDLSKRLAKYAKKGYTINRREFVKVLEAICQEKLAHSIPLCGLDMFIEAAKFKPHEIIHSNIVHSMVASNQYEVLRNWYTNHPEDR